MWSKGLSIRVRCPDFALNNCIHLHCGYVSREGFDKAVQAHLNLGAYTISTKISCAGSCVHIQHILVHVYSESGQ